MSEWDYTNERGLFWVHLNGDVEWVCSTITSQKFYDGAPMIIRLAMRPSRLFKICCYGVPSTRKKSTPNIHRVLCIGAGGCHPLWHGRRESKPRQQPDQASRGIIPKKSYPVFKYGESQAPSPIFITSWK
ncbi:core histone macro-H2A.1 [Trichonephila clavipes]|nr:core histone macro-H2A.1 [Trichonephila clavipes]